MLSVSRLILHKNRCYFENSFIFLRKLVLADFAMNKSLTHCISISSITLSLRQTTIAPEKGGVQRYFVIFEQNHILRYSVESLQLVHLYNQIRASLSGSVRCV